LRPDKGEGLTCGDLEKRKKKKEPSLDRYREGDTLGGGSQEGETDSP